MLFVSAGNQLFAYDDTVWPPTLTASDVNVDATSDDSPAGLTRTVYRGGYAGSGSSGSAAFVHVLQEPVSFTSGHKGWGVAYASSALVSGDENPNFGGNQVIVGSGGGPTNAETAAWIAPYIVDAGGLQLYAMALTKAQQVDVSGNYGHMIIVYQDGSPAGQYQFVDTTGNLFYFKNALPCHDPDTGITYYVRGGLSSTVFVDTAPVSGGHQWEVWAFDPTFSFGDSSGNYFVASAASLGNINFFPDTLCGHLDANGNIIAVGNAGNVCSFTPAGALNWMLTSGSGYYDQMFADETADHDAAVPQRYNAYEINNVLDHAALSSDGTHLYILAERKDVSGSSPTATYGTARARSGFYDMAIWRFDLTTQHLVAEEPFAIEGFTNGAAHSPVATRAQALWSTIVSLALPLPNLAGDIGPRRTAFWRPPPHRGGVL